MIFLKYSHKIDIKINKKRDMKNLKIVLAGLLVGGLIGLSSCSKDEVVEPIEVVENYSVEDLSGVWQITNSGSLKEVYIEHRGNILTIIEWGSDSYIDGNELEYNYFFDGNIINSRRIEIKMGGEDNSRTYRTLTR